MKRNLSFLIFLLLTAATSAYSQSVAPAPDSQTVTFRFPAGNDLFILTGNESELARLYALVDEYRDRIAAGEMPLRVDGYCASLPTAKENLHTAYLRANRVKSELITRKGLREAHFITANYATACNGDKDVVVVTLRIPVKAGTPIVKKEPQPEPGTASDSAQQQVAEIPVPMAEENSGATTKEPAAEIVPAFAETSQPYRFALRTNLLYDALLLPTLGVEWRVNSDIGVKLDGSLSRWGGEHGKVQKVWLLHPEVRWYLLRDRRLYAGVAGSYGEYNIYRYMPGNAFSKDTGYQGTLWSAGLAVGYQLRLARSLSVDFNLGLGYVRSHYDSFGLTHGVRVYKDRDKTKNFFGPTQAGISLVWTMGGGK